MRNWDKASALKLWEKGKSDPEIADAVGVSVTTVLQWRKKEGLAANHKPGWPNKAKASAPSEPTPEPETVEPPDDSGPEGTDLDVDGPEGTDLDVDGPEGTDLDVDGSEAPGESWPPGPVELHVELCGGLARIRAPGWEQAAQLWRMLNVCISALTRGGGEDG